MSRSMYFLVFGTLAICTLAKDDAGFLIFVSDCCEEVSVKGIGEDLSLGISVSTTPVLLILICVYIRKVEKRVKRCFFEIKTEILNYILTLFGGVDNSDNPSSSCSYPENSECNRLRACSGVN